MPSFLRRVLLATAFGFTAASALAGTAPVKPGIAKTPFR